MKIMFKTLSYCFFADFNDNSVAKKIIEHLPLESSVQKDRGKICFFLGIEIPEGVDAVEFKGENLVYSLPNKSLCICMEDITKVMDPNSRVFTVGKILSLTDELKQLPSGEKTKISFEEKDDPYDNRILSQNEIDSLVESLFKKSEKKVNN